MINTIGIGSFDSTTKEIITVECPYCHETIHFAFDDKFSHNHECDADGNLKHCTKITIN